jgi:hypothetical protein
MKKGLPGYNTERLAIVGNVFVATTNEEGVARL